MSENRLEPLRTLTTPRLYAEALLRYWPEASFPAAGVLWAQYMAETSNENVWRYNLGNFKHRTGDGYDWQMLPGVWEGVSPSQADTLIASGAAVLDTNPKHIAAVGPNKVSVVFQPPRPETWFRAYPSLEAGMKDKIGTLRSRWAPAWEYVVRGDPEGFARKLGAMGYYTASPDAYAALMRPHFDKWLKTGPKDVWVNGPGPAPTPNASRVPMGVTLVALGLGVLGVAALYRRNTGVSLLDKIRVA